MPNQGYPEDTESSSGLQTDVKRECPNYAVAADSSVAAGVLRSTVNMVGEAREEKIQQATACAAVFSENSTRTDGSDLRDSRPSNAELNSIEDGMNTLSRWIGAWAVRKGWIVLGEKPRDTLHQLMLIVSELAEAAEAYREGNPRCLKPGCEYISAVEEELADVIIRTLQMGVEHDMNLVEAVISKMTYNETRPHRHGKKC